MQELIQRARDLIGRGELEEALKALSVLLPEQWGGMADAFLQLKGEYANLEDDRLFGRITRDDSSTKYMQLTSRFLSMLNRLENPPPSSPPVPPPSSVRKILFLAANPFNTGRLRLDIELREIEESLRLAQRRDQFAFHSRMAVRARDLRNSLLEELPQIVHFSGHGVSLSASEAESSRLRDLMLEHDDPNVPSGLSGGLILQDSRDDDGYRVVRAEALGSLFGLLSEDAGSNIECVILSACYSANQADAIKPHVPYVIGMSHRIPDETAITFSQAFYDALGTGRDIPFAFRFAKNALVMDDLPGADLPILISRDS